MVLGMILAAFYAIALRSETWSARQSLIVRDDLLGQSYKPGQFDSLDSMKSAQETIFEIARKPEVIRNALQQLGPPSTSLFGSGDYPSDEVIEETQGNISFSAPNGAEFGRTEVIILNTKSNTRERAREFTEVLVGEIIAKVNEVRLRKFQSMESEILQTCEVAESSLDESKNKLKEMDQQLGEDAGAMVGLGESSFRDDPLSREIAQLNLERRGVRSEVEQIDSMLQSLRTAKQDPEAIVNISSELSVRQPALDALKQEMVQLKGEYAQLSGRYTSIHPAVESARDGIVVMQDQIRLELANAESDTIKQLEIETAKLERLDSGIAKLKQRMSTLGEKRADSITLFADIKKRTEILNDARANLAEVQGLAASKNTDLLTTMADVQVSTRPDGLGKKALVLCGALGGLMFGMGMVMLMAPPAPPELTRGASQLASAPAPGQTTTSQTPTTQARPEQTRPDKPPQAQPSPPEKPALADVGLAKAQSGLAASTNVLRDLLPSAKSNEAEPSTPVDEKELQKQRLIDARLESVKAIKGTKPEETKTKLGETKPAETKLQPETKPALKQSSLAASPKPVQSQPKTSTTETPASSPFLRKGEGLEATKDKPAIGAKIMPVSKPAAKVPETKPVVKEPVVKAPETSVEPAKLAKPASAVASSTTPKELPEVEVPGAKPEKPDGEFNKMVDKAFEGETKSRVEAQTVQLDVLSKVLGGTTAGALGAGALGAAAAGLTSPASASPATTPSTPATPPTPASPPRGAQIKPRSANVRPVDLARQAEKETNPTAKTPEPTEKTPELRDKTKDLISQPGNPFLKDRSATSGSSAKATSKATNAKKTEDAAVVPVPDQIRKLSDSIASFAKPVKSNVPGKEKF